MDLYQQNYNNLIQLIPALQLHLSQLDRWRVSLQMDECPKVAAEIFLNEKFSARPIDKFFQSGALIASVASWALATV
jgi:hypothetical protein